jgi:protein SCO1/2
VTHSDFIGKVVALNLMFTGCSLSSGEVFTRMAELQRRTAGMSDVLLVSLTVDPKTDTPAVLTEFANARQADTNRWLFLTGDKEEIRRLVETSFFPRTEEEKRAFPTAFNGIDSITLLDRRGKVEQSFDGLDPGVVDAVMPQLQKLHRRYGR